MSWRDATWAMHPFHGDPGPITIEVDGQTVQTMTISMGPVGDPRNKIACQVHMFARPAGDSMSIDNEDEARDTARTIIERWNACIGMADPVAEIARLRQMVSCADALAVRTQDLLDTMNPPPDRNCSCHLSPPCNDCVDHGGLRDAIADAEDAIAEIEAAHKSLFPGEQS